MNIIDAVPYVLYSIYNQLAIHNAPLFVLDLFLPILTTASWEESLRKEMKNAKTFETWESLLVELKS